LPQATTSDEVQIELLDRQMCDALQQVSFMQVGKDILFAA
jgi:hypothetical protein